LASRQPANATLKTKIQIPVDELVIVLDLLNEKLGVLDVNWL